MSASSHGNIGRPEPSQKTGAGLVTGAPGGFGHRAAGV